MLKYGGLFFALSKSPTCSDPGLWHSISSLSRGISATGTPHICCGPFVPRWTLNYGVYRFHEGLEASMARSQPKATAGRTLQQVPKPQTSQQCLCLKPQWPVDHNCRALTAVSSRRPWPQMKSLVALVVLDSHNTEFTCVRETRQYFLSINQDAPHTEPAAATGIDQKLALWIPAKLGGPCRPPGKKWVGGRQA
jgi:hypothetical protein